MPGTYTKLLYHIVFSTKHRLPQVVPEIQPRLYAYLGGIIRSERGVLLAAGGMPDHVHLYLRWRPDASVSDLMRVLKSESSKWVHDTFVDALAFRWQEGYSAFTVSTSVEPQVMAYIANQESHHAGKDFKTELLQLLRMNDIEFDERYVFD